jgi:tight adherence protein B
MWIFWVGVLLVAGALLAMGYALFAPAAKASELDREAAETDSQSDEGRVLVLLDRGMNRLNFTPYTELELENAGVNAPPASVVALSLVAAAVALVLVFVLTHGFAFAVFAMLLPPLAIKFWIRSKAEKRKQQFTEQMAEMTTMLSSALKGGLNVSSALAEVAAEIEAPMGEELTRVVNETRLGRDVVVALKDSAQRVDNQDLVWLADAIAIQRESGGRLSEILERVNETIADRQELRAKIVALSAEGRMSAIVLMALPVVASGMFAFVNPTFLAPLWTTGAGRLVFIGAVTLWILGGLWLRQMTKVKL